MDLNSYYPIISSINLIAAIACMYYGRKLYESTKGATEFWLFLSAFIASLGTYILFDFARVTFLTWFDPPLRSAQDLSIAFAATFALISGIYAKKMFDELLGD